MEFWGVEVKPGKPLKVKPDEDNIIHISQASLECKGKMGESVVLSVTVGNTKLVIGTLSQEKFPQISYDLVFDKEFELSHNCSKASVHFVGYQSPNIEEGDYFSGSDEEEEEEVPEAVPAALTANGNAGTAASTVVRAESKPNAKLSEVKPESDNDEDDSDEEDESDDDDDSEKGMDVDEDDSDDDDDSEDEEEEETPKKPEPINKKRPNESASKTPVSVKKAKPAAGTPQKTEEKKKGVHIATPHPAKKGGKTPVNANQSPGQSSGGNKNKKPFNSGKQFGGSNNKNSNKGKGKGRA